MENVNKKPKTKRSHTQHHNQKKPYNILMFDVGIS